MLRIDSRSAVIAVVGLGYVGLPLLIAADEAGFPVIGLDSDGEKVAGLQRGESHISDIGAEQIAALTQANFNTDAGLLGQADVLIIAVPTPLRNGTPDLSLVETASAQIGKVLREGQLVVLESTTYPGTTQDLVRPLLESSGLEAGKDFALAYSPERIDPGSEWTLKNTPKIVAGLTPADTEAAVQFYSAFVDRVVVAPSPREAEMAKLIENTFRQVNIALVNELATIAPAIGVDLWASLEAAASKPFGYMPFWPGPGVGGHCIAIDPTYLSWKVEQRLGFGIGFIEHARSVNNRMPAFVAGRIAETLNNKGAALKGARIVVLGLTYKPGVNDVREAPALAVLERLMAAGADCAYHDPYIPSVFVGGRRKEDLLRPNSNGGQPEQLFSVPLTDEILAGADCVVILTAHSGIDYPKLANSPVLVFDAVGATRDLRTANVELL